MREVTIDNLLFKAFTAAQLFPEESATLETLLQQSEKEWMAKQQEMLNAVKLQEGQINQKIERLTDCYLEGGLDKDTYETRKSNLLVESKTKEATEKGILLGMDKIFARVRKFLELSKDLKKSYEIGILEEQREFLQIVTSNLEVIGRNLIILMKSPFLELAQRHILSSGEPERDGSRIDNLKYAPGAKSLLIYSEVNTSPIIGEPLSEDKLRLLLDLIISQVSQLPVTNEESSYDI
jgi:hypothetical protein